MTTGTLIRPTRIDKEIIDYHSTLNCKEKQQILDEQSISKTENSEDIPAIYYDEKDSVNNELYQVPFESASGRLAERITQRHRITQEKGTNIWESKKFRKLLEEPVGSPITLTREEAMEIVLLAAGRRPDLPTGKEYVTETRAILGHSLTKRVEKAS